VRQAQREGQKTCWEQRGHEPLRSGLFCWLKVSFYHRYEAMQTDCSAKADHSRQAKEYGKRSIASSALEDATITTVAE
jgi:hypothetical protein